MYVILNSRVSIIIQVYLYFIVYANLVYTQVRRCTNINDFQFEEHDQLRQVVVNIVDRNYNDRQWELDLFPCSHAYTTIVQKGFGPRILYVVV